MAWWRSRGVVATVLAAGLAAAAGVTAGLLISSLSGSGTPAPPARARVYANVDACLLTGPGGIADPAVAPAWAGLEDLSASGRARVSYLAVTGPATTANALPYLGSLVLRKCAVIVAAEGPERAAVLADATRFPSVRFVLVGAGAGQVPSNVDVLASQGAAARAAVAGAVGSAVTS
jgi:hypothetical protein